MANDLNLWKKWTGAGLTRAQEEQNTFNQVEAQAARAFNANEAEKARQWEEQMSNTAYQRQAADMIAAGVNPALAMNGGAGASTPGGATASGPAATASDNNNGLSLSELMSTLMAPLSVMQQIEQIKSVKSDIDLKEVEARSKEQGINESKAREEGILSNNKWIDTLNQDRHETSQEALNLTREQEKTLAKNRELADADIALKTKQANTEEEKKNLIKLQQITEGLRQKEIFELLPYKKAEMAATTAAQRASAQYSAMLTMIEQKKLDHGYYDALIAEAQAKARVQLTAAEREEFRQRIRTGDIINFDSVKSDADNVFAKVWNFLVEEAEYNFKGVFSIVSGTLDYAGSVVGNVLGATLK